MKKYGQADVMCAVIHIFLAQQDKLTDEQLKEQLNVIASLRTKGFLNEAKYKEQSAEISNKISKLNKDLRLLSQSDDTALKDIEMLINYFEKREHIMIEFEPQAFEFLIDKIVVKDNILEFHIIGGLIFTEEI